MHMCSPGPLTDRAEARWFFRSASYDCMAAVERKFAPRLAPVPSAVNERARADWDADDQAAQMVARGFWRAFLVATVITKCMEMAQPFGSAPAVHQIIDLLAYSVRIPRVGRAIGWARLGFEFGYFAAFVWNVHGRL